MNEFQITRISSDIRSETQNSKVIMNQDILDHNPVPLSVNENVTKSHRANEILTAAGQAQPQPATASGNSADNVTINQPSPQVGEQISSQDKGNAEGLAPPEQPEIGAGQIRDQHRWFDEATGTYKTKYTTVEKLAQDVFYMSRDVPHSGHQDAEEDDMPALTDGTISGEEDDPGSDDSDDLDDDWGQGPQVSLLGNEPAAENQTAAGETIRVTKIAQYKSQKNADRYSIPRVDNFDQDLYVDKRSTLEIFRDLLLLINGKVSPETAEVWSKLTGYDVKTRTLDRESGMSLLRQDMLALLKDFRDKKRQFTETERDMIKQCEGEAKKISGENIPERIWHGGYDATKPKPPGLEAAKKAPAKEQESSSKTVCTCRVAYNTEGGDTRQIEDMINWSPDGLNYQRCVCPPRPAAHVNSVESPTSLEPSTRKDRLWSKLAELYVDTDLSDTERKEVNNLVVKGRIGKFKPAAGQSGGTLARIEGYHKKQQQRRQMDKAGLDTATPPQHLKIAKVGGTRLPYITVLLQHGGSLDRSPCQALLDSGSECNLITQSRLTAMGIAAGDLKEEKGIVLVTPSQQHRNTVQGSVNLDIFLPYRQSFYLVEALRFLVVPEEQFQLNNALILGSQFFQQTSSNLKYSPGGDKTLICRAMSDIGKWTTVSVHCEERDSPRKICSTITELETINGRTTVGVNTFSYQPGVYDVYTDTGAVRPLVERVWVEKNEIEAGPCGYRKVWPRQKNCFVHIPVRHVQESQSESPDEGFTVYLPRSRGRLEEPAAAENGSLTPSLDPEQMPRDPESRERKDKKLQSSGGCPHILHLQLCSHVSLTDRDLCTSEHKGDIYCPCPRQEPTPEFQALYRQNKRRMEINEVKFSKQNSQDPVVPSKEDLDAAPLNRNDLLYEADKKPAKAFELGSLSAEQKAGFLEVAEKYPEVWVGGSQRVGLFKYFKCSLSVDQEKAEKGALIQRNRATNFGKAPAAKKKVEELLRDGILEYSSAPAKGISNFVLTPKCRTGSSLRYQTKIDKHLARGADGGGIDYRLAVDCSTINGALNAEYVVSLPTIEDVKALIDDAVVSTADIADGFFCIPLEENSKRYTAVYYEQKLVVFARLVQGLKNAPFVFIRAMQATLHDDILAEFVQKKGWSKDDFPYDQWSSFSLAYVDDVIIATKTTVPDYEKVHLRCIEAFIYAVARAGLLLGKNKFKPFCDSVVFLGHTLHSRGRYSSMSAERAEAILSARTPLSIGECSSRLSFILFSSSYLPLCKLVLVPIQQMILSGVFKWTKAEAESFNNLKMLVLLRIKNYIFDPNKLHFLVTDASKVAAGVVLLQAEENGELLPIITHCKIFSTAQMRQSSVLREAAALMFGVEKCRPFLLQCRNPMSILTDCQALQAIRRNREFEHRFFEYSLCLSQYNVQVLYIPGQVLSFSDEISRSFNDCFIEKGTRISEAAAKIFPPVPTNMFPKPGIIGHEELVDFLLGEVPEEYIDVFDRDTVYAQPKMHNSDIEKLLVGLLPETQVLNFLSEGWNVAENYDAPVIRDLVRQVSVLSKTGFQEVLRKLKLTPLKKHLEDIGFVGKLGQNMTRTDWNPHNQKETNKKTIKVSQVLTRAQTQKALAQQEKQISRPRKPRKKKATPSTGIQGGSQAKSSLTPMEGGASPGDNPEALRRCRRKGDGPPALRNEKELAVRQGATGDCCPTHSTRDLEKIRLGEEYGDNIRKFLRILGEYNDLCRDSQTRADRGSNIQAWYREPCKARRFDAFIAEFGRLAGELASGPLEISPDKDGTDGLKKHLRNLRFYPVNFQSSDFKLEYRSTAVVVQAKRRLRIPPLGTITLNGRIYVRTSCGCDLVSLMPEDEIFVDLSAFKGTGLYLEQIPVINVTVEEKLIKEGTDIFMVDFENYTQHQLVPIQIEDSCLRNHLKSMEEFQFFSMSRAAPRLLYGFLDSKANRQIISCCHPFDHQSTCQCALDTTDPDRIRLIRAEVNRIRKRTTTETGEPAEEDGATARVLDWFRFTNTDPETKRLQMLNAALFSVHLAKLKGVFRFRDIKEAQLADNGLGKTIARCRKAQGSRGPYKLKGDLLYKSCTLAGIEVDKLMLPDSITRMLLKSWHSTAASRHYGPRTMQTLFENIFYCKGIQTIAQSVYKECLLCQLTKPSLAQRRPGERRTWMTDPDPAIGKIWFGDTAIMPKSKSGHTAMVVFTEAVTNYVWASPIRNVSSTNVAEAIRTWASFYPWAEALQTDHGSEFLGKAAETLRGLAIAHWTPTPGASSDSVGAAEVSIRLLKGAMRKLVYQAIGDDHRTSWVSFVPEMLRRLNSQRLKGLSQSRAGLFFSFLHNLSAPSPIDVTLTPEQACELQGQSCRTLMKMREAVLGRLRRRFPKFQDLRKGQIVVLTRADKNSPTQSDGTKALSLPQPRLLKVLETHSDTGQVFTLNLSSGDRKTYHRKLLRALEAQDVASLSLVPTNFLADLRNSRAVNTWKKQKDLLQLRHLHEKPDIQLPPEVYKRSFETEEGQVRGTPLYAITTGEGEKTASELKGAPASKKKLLGSILKGVQTRKERDTYSYGQTELEAIKRAAKTTLEAGLGWTSQQKQLLSQHRDPASSMFYQTIPPTDPLSEIQARKDHPRSVRFQERIQEKGERVNLVFPHSWMGLYLRTIYCVSIEELACYLPQH